jgi:hypothetical protein
MKSLFEPATVNDIKDRMRISGRTPNNAGLHSYLRKLDIQFCIED